MAQRKPTTPATGSSTPKPAAKVPAPKTPAAKTPAATAPAAKPAAAKTPVPAKAKPAARTRPATKAGGPRRPTKSIVNQRQTPWGTIIAAVVVAAFAIGIVTFAVTRTSKNSTSYLNALGDATKISGVTFTKEPDRQHITSGTVTYDKTPPVGGNHSPYWADCTGTVYPQAIANENAVHDLEHGAVWITYKPGLPAAEIATLAKYVTGINYMVMSPYPGLKTDISLQSWGYQLAVTSPTDPRIQKFIDTLKVNPTTTPEYGADCSQPTFKAKPSTFGHPLFAPAT